MFRTVFPKSVLLLLTALFCAFSTKAQIAGDVSGDNIVDASDYLMLKYIAIGSKKETRTSDINGNGKVNVQDLLILENYIYKNGPDPPAVNLALPKSPVQLTPGIVDLEKKTIEILLSSKEEIGAFQFEIQGIGKIVELLEGSAKDKEFTLLSEGVRVLGVIGKGRPILSGESMLLKIRFSIDAFEKACIFEPIVLTTASSPFQVQLGECIKESATMRGLEELKSALVSGASLNPNSDLNHDGYVDISDLILLENFLFRDGPPPPGSKTELNKKVKLSIESIDLEAKKILVRVHHSKPISGLQMRFSGVDNITSIVSEKFENNDFSVAYKKNNVLAHIGEGIPLLPGKGVLFEVSYDEAIGSEVCIGNPIISNPEGSPYVIVLGECVSLIKPVLGCMDSASLTYNPLATVDDGSCTYPPKPPKPVREKKPKEEVLEIIAMNEPGVKGGEKKIEKVKKEKMKKEKEVKSKKVKEEKVVKEKTVKKEKVKKTQKIKPEKEKMIEEEKPVTAMKEKVAEEKNHKNIKERKKKEELEAEKDSKSTVKKVKKPKEKAVKEPKQEKVKKPEKVKSLSVNDINKGVMVPIVTTDQRANLSDLRKGTMVYDSDVQGYVFYDGKEWKMVGSTADKSPKKLFRKIPILGLWFMEKRG